MHPIRHDHQISSNFCADKYLSLTSYRLLSMRLSIPAFLACVLLGQAAGASTKPVSFVNEVVPILTKAGCNGGACHGKSGGQNGFRLSLFGFEPAEDFEHLVIEGRGRRLSPSAPDYSLLLRKGMAAVPHTGGRRIEPGQEGYERLKLWIAQGMRSDVDDPARPVLQRIEVLPPLRLMKRGESQPLKVVAHFHDGSTLDVTRFTMIEPNDKAMAKVSEEGVVTMLQLPGDVSVMARYQDKMAVFRATVLVGATVNALPPVVNYVDQHIFAKLQQVGVPPSTLCTDTAFLRRSTLDIAGRLPTAVEARAFLASTRPDKRAQWVDSLLAGTDYADNFANYWSALLRNRRGDIDKTRDDSHIWGTFAFHGWIRDSLHSGKPFDQFVREIITASGEISDCPPVAWYRQVRTLQQQTEDTAQLFMGVRMQCAQCHHHPYERWSQRDYESLGAYFSQIERQPTVRLAEERIFPRRALPEVISKKNGAKLLPAALGTSAPALTADDDARLALADWLSKPDNPFFARSLVNRYWKHFFNRGIVDPEDDMRDTNPPSHPELLEALAHDFVTSGYDLKKLIRTLVTSSTYQLSSTPNQYNREDQHYFSRYYARRLTAEALLDAVEAVTGSSTNWPNQPPGTRALQLPDDSYNKRAFFLEVFGRPDSASACTCERQMSASLSQSLMLANSDDVKNKLGDPHGVAVNFTTDTQRSDSAKFQELYFSAYARPATADELRLATTYLAQKTALGPDARRAAWEDLLWVVMSSKEFLFNH